MAKRTLWSADQKNGRSVTSLDAKIPKPRVVISVNSTWNIFNFRRGLIAGINRSGFEVVLAAHADEFVGRLKADGYRFHPLPIVSDGTSPIGDIGLLFSYVRVFRTERPAVYLGYTIKPNIYGTLAARLCGVPVINNVAGLGTSFIRETWLTRLVMALYRLAFRGSHTVFFQNEDDRTLFVERRLVDRAKTRLLPGSGIDLSGFPPAPLPSETKENGIALILIARLLWDKGVLEFVEAARIVRRSRPNVRFQLLGFLDVENRTAVDRTSVERWVAEGIIEYLGSTDDVRPFIAAADCVVLPSYYREGTPRTLLEGAAMGRPLIATDTPGCRDVVEDGANGLLCKARDAADLAGKMLEFLDLSFEARASMGRAGRAKVEREFDERIVIDRYLQVINDILGQRRERAASPPSLRHRMPPRSPTN